ncbi:type II secretion system protein N [Noviherbaspirillum sp.]|jgi:general secretion pathway protein C|uniref:type II secretion system protein N n=1 Tax=Noviherbaspirillum sp. TaxID=1926288 RepID=UPI0025FE7E68|nr:type II secretion system protein N [Noviherbaspirillum sp.]
MKRLPLAASFLMFMALCASVAYWAMQLFKPPVRPVAPPVRVAAADVHPDAAAALFGGRSGPVAVASNYQLRGVIFSGNPHDSIAILSADGKPAQPVRVDAEVVPGVKVKEVHRGYVLLSEGGATKRVELPENAKGQGGIAMTPSGSPASPAPAQSPAVSGRPGQMTPPAATTAPPTMVVSPPPSAAQTQTQPTANGSGSSAATMPAPTAGLPSPVVTPTPVPAVPTPMTPAPATPQVAAPAPAVAPSPQNAAPAAQPYAPFTNQVPPGTPGPNTPLQSR